MAVNYSGSVWDETFWFPPGKPWGWADLVNTPGSGIYYPEIKDLHWALLMGVILLGVRYILEICIVVPIGLRMGVSNRPKPVIQPNAQLEEVYRKHKRINPDVVKMVSKQTDLTERQVDIWLRKRKKQDQSTPIQKFRECSWHLIFYTTFFIYGLTILWQKPYFWKTIYCWDSWPTQHVSNDVYWYYMMELGFYWSLVFSLCSDHKRKDFKEMIIHHFATIVLMYFSWILNFVRVGTLVLAVHDAADTWLALAKMSIYTKNKTATDIFFGIFLIVWVASRLIVFPFVVLYSTTVEPYTADLMTVTFGAHWFFNFFLYILQVLHGIWTYLIFRIVYRKLRSGSVEDVRSDSEEDDQEEEDDDDEAVENNKDIKQNGKSKANADVQNGFISQSDIPVNGNRNVIKARGEALMTNGETVITNGHCDEDAVITNGHGDEDAVITNGHSDGIADAKHEKDNASRDIEMVAGNGDAVKPNGVRERVTVSPSKIPRATKKV